jgi:glucose-6-phosphate 1-dehydrogenase
VLRAGKALNERSVVVRMQLHAHPVPLFGTSAAHNEMRNEFVMRLQPGEQQQLLGLGTGWVSFCKKKLKYGVGWGSNM